MFEKLSHNLNVLMDEIRISADELGRRTGLPSSTIKKIRNCYNPNPTLTTLIPLADFFSVTLGQLVGNEPLPNIQGLYQVNSDTLYHIPIVSWEEAARWPETHNESHQTVTTEHHYDKHAYALLVEDDHWENLAAGTALLIDPSLKPEHRDFIITLKEGHKLPTLKQLLLDEDHMYLKPVVQGYHITAFTPDHTILGVVVEYKKNLKRPTLSRSTAKHLR